MSTEEMWSIVTEKLDAWLTAVVAMLPNFGLAVLVLILFWLVAKVVRAVVRRGMSRISNNRAVINLFATLTYVALLAVGFFMALGVLQLDKTVISLLAGAGILGLALAFAFQDATENLISGITISVRKPFVVGDFIETNDFLGTVEDITLRYTAIRRPQGQVVLIPNSMVFKNPLINYTETSDRRVDLDVGVSYAADLEEAKRVAIEAVSGVPGRNEARDVELFYTGFGGSSIDFVVRFWLTDAYQGSFMAARSEAIVRIKDAFDRAGITIPFPIRTLDFGIEGGATLTEMLEGRQAGSGGERPAAE